MGVERNPFIAILARAKVAARVRGPELAQGVTHELRSFAKQYARARKRHLVTESVTLNNPQYFPRRNVLTLFALSAALQTVEDQDVRDLLAVTIAASIEPSGKLRRDGRA